MRTLVINGLAIALPSALQLEQEYNPVQAVSRIRMSDGSLQQQVAWHGKISTQISGSGVMPLGLQGLDYLSPVTIQCIAERIIISASTMISIPSARRSDYPVEGKALVSGQWQTTAVSMAADTATLTAVAGATQYQAIYWPELVCLLDPPREGRNARQSAYDWSITAEEI